MNNLKTRILTFYCKECDGTAEKIEETEDSGVWTIVPSKCPDCNKKWDVKYK